MSLLIDPVNATTPCSGLSPAAFAINNRRYHVTKIGCATVNKELRPQVGALEKFLAKSLDPAAEKRIFSPEEAEAGRRVLN
jgi:hypothetical protein